MSPDAIAAAHEKMCVRAVCKWCVCVCGCSVCFALQLSLCASQHLGSYHDAYHLQILQVTTPYNVYQNLHAHTVLVQTRSVYHSAASHA